LPLIARNAGNYRQILKKPAVSGFTGPIQKGRHNTPLRCRWERENPVICCFFEQIFCAKQLIFFFVLQSD